MSLRGLDRGKGDAGRCGHSERILSALCKGGAEIESSAES